MAQKKRNIKFGFIFWIAFIALVALLFFINKSNIQTVLKNIERNNTKKEQTENLHGQIQNEIERINEENKLQIEAEVPAAEDRNPKTDVQPDIVDSTTEKKNTEEPSAKTETSKKDKTAAESKKAKKDNEPSPKETTKKTDAKTIAVETPKSPVSSRISLLYFVAIDADGAISRVAVKRSLPVSDSPLSDALKSLFTGTTAEEGKKYRSLIPPGTKLLSATVRDDIAYINVSENFEFNRYGIEGYLAELAQVVYTATEFPTVTAVQFLVEGQKKNYLGSDGVWIGSPLSRESFK